MANENQETVAEIIAEMRAKAKHFEECSSLMVSESALALFLYPIAYRLEEAWKRDSVDIEAKVTRITRNECRAEYAKERGNSEKMCEALERIVSLTNSLDENCAVDPVEIRDIARNALVKGE